MQYASSTNAPRAEGDGGTPAGGAIRPIPGPKEIVSFDDGVDPIAFLGRLLADHGDVVRYRTPQGASFLFAHPDHVQAILQREHFRRASLVKMILGEGLLASDGPYWRAQRQRMQKDFQPGRVAAFASVITRQTSRTESEWRAAAETGKVVDVAAAMTRLTLRVVVAALFSEELQEDACARLCEAVTQTITELGRISWTIFGAAFHFTPEKNSAFAAAKEVIDAFCNELINRRRKMPVNDRPGDLLSLLLASDPKFGPMNDQQLRDEMVTMLVGGHETTALALAWAWKELAVNRAVAAQLQDEADAMPGERMPEAADLPRLSWARATFQEALRLYPPVWQMGRVAMKADDIDGYAIPKGACLLITPWFTHRHPDFWRDPHTFDPSRFLDGSAPDHRCAYFPFAGGRHLCLGMHLGMMEGPLILAQLARRFVVRPVNAAEVRPMAGVTLRQTPNLRAMIERRGPERSAGI